MPFFAGNQQASSESTAPTTDAASAPQRDAPPQLVLGAMKWLPRPSFRAVALVGALAALYVARNNHKGARRLAA
jgi:protease I